MKSWLARVAAGAPGSEHEVVNRYTEKLLALASRHLPPSLRARVDAEDIVQSVYRSFFRRLGGRRFCFEESHDLWRLLVTITFYKIYNTVKYHQRQQRDVRRETSVREQTIPSDWDGRRVGSRDLEVLYECLDRLLQVLPEPSRTIVIRRLQGETIEEIAAHVGRSRRTVIRVLAHVQDLGGRMLENRL